MQVFGSGPTAMVCFMADEKSVHIHEMIMQQKKPKTKAKIRNHNRNNFSMYPNNKGNNIQPVLISGHQLSPFQSVKRQHAVRTVKFSSAPSSFTNNLKREMGNNIDFNTLPQSSDIISDNNFSAKTTQAYKLQKCNELDKVCNLMTTNLLITQPTSRKCESDLNNLSPNELVTSPATVSTKTNKLLANIKPPKPKQYSQPTESSPVANKLISMRQHIPFSNSTQESSPRCTSEEIETKKSPSHSEVLDLKLNKDKSNTIFNITKEEEEEKESDEAIPSFAAVSFQSMYLSCNLLVIFFYLLLQKFNVFRLDFPNYVVSFGRKIAPCKISNDIVVGSCIKLFITEVINMKSYCFFFL